MSDAKRAGNFLSSIGVNTHISQGWDTTQTIQDTKYIGAQIARDNISSTSDSVLIANYKQVAASGIKLDLVASGALVNVASYISDVKQIKAASPGMLAAVEGFNEPNNQPVTYNGQTTVNGGNYQPAYDGMVALYNAIKGDASLGGMTVYDLSETNLNGQTIGLGHIAGHADVANQHSYPDHGQNLWVSDGIDPNTGQPYPVWGYKEWGNEYSEITNQLIANTIPGTMTEFGWYTYPDTINGVSERAQAILTLNGYLGNFQHGFVSSFVYLLWDEALASPIGDPERNYGLFRADNTPKPAAVALHNLTTILQDTATNASTFATGILNYTLTGMPSLGRSMLIEKASGTFETMLWNDATVYDCANQANVSVPTSTVTDSLGATYATVNVYDPTLGTSPIKTLHNVSSVQVGLADHPLVIEVSGPVPAPPAPTPTPIPTPTPTPIPAGTATDTLMLSMSEDAWQGDAQAVITVDGKTIGGAVTVTALHNQGKTQAVTLAGQWGPGAHAIGVQFINDAWGGTAATDRNLYVNGVTLDGQASAAPPMTLYSNGTAHFMTAASPLVLQLSEDAYQGDAQFTVAMDGKMLGGAQAVTALHAKGGVQNFAFGQPMAAGTHDVAVSFLNDAWGGTAATDRNLYVNAVDVNGTATGGTASLMTTSTQHFSVVVAAHL